MVAPNYAAARSHLAQADGARPATAAAQIARLRPADLRTLRVCARAPWPPLRWRRQCERGHPRECARPSNEIRSSAGASGVRAGQGARTARSRRRKECLARACRKTSRTGWRSARARYERRCRQRRLAPVHLRHWGARWSQARLGSHSPAPCSRRCDRGRTRAQSAAELDDIAIAIVPLLQQREVVDDLVDGRHGVGRDRVHGCALADI